MRCSSEIHKITKLENHEGKAITAEELVEQYYKDPGKYFEVSSSLAVDSPTAIAISDTSIEMAEPVEIKNNKIDEVLDEYSLDMKNRGKSQRILDINIKSIKILIIFLNFF